MTSTQDRIREYLRLAPSVDITEYYDVIQGMLALTDRERVEVLAAMRSFFCLECGRDLALNERCHCSNDE